LALFDALLFPLMLLDAMAVMGAFSIIMMIAEWRSPHQNNAVYSTTSPLLILCFWIIALPVDGWIYHRLWRKLRVQNIRRRGDGLPPDER
jgi:hypothetical protein